MTKSHFGVLVIKINLSYHSCSFCSDCVGKSLFLEAWQINQGWSCTDSNLKVSQMFLLSLILHT